MDFVGSAFVLIVIFGSAYAAYSRYKRNQLITYAEKQQERLRRFVAQAPFDVDSRIALKQGEVVVYELKNARLAETRRGPRVTQRQTDAFTFRFAPGLYYTAAGGKSVSDAVDEMSEIDMGHATFTNKRVIFIGQKQNREWDFAKLLGWETGAGGYLMMAVSNRQKMSGICGPRNELMAPAIFELAQIVAKDGFAQAKVSAQSAIYSAGEQAKVAKSFTFFNGEAVNQRFKELDRIMDKRGDELAEAGYHGWLDPGVPIPQTSPSAKTAPESPAKYESPALGKVPEELEVVGEFFHPEAFEALRKMFATEGDSEHIVEAEIRCDPDNPYSDSGMAVAVFVRDQHVGHIPEALAPAIYEMVDAKGGKVTLGARLWLDHEDSRPGKSSVQIFVDSRLTG